MIIAIDGNEANIKNRVGVNQFAYGVMWGVYKLKVKSATPHHVGCRAGPKPEQVRFGAGVKPRTTSGAGQAPNQNKFDSGQEFNPAPRRVQGKPQTRINSIRGKSSKIADIKFLVFLREKPLGDLPPETDWWKYEVFGPKKFWTWTGLVKRLYFGRPRPDILFSPSHYGPGFSPIPFVISIMDLGFLRFPEQFTKKDFYQLKYWTAWSVKRAAKTITISEFSKRDIVKTYGIDQKKIIVAYPGYIKVKSETPNQNKFGSGQEFNPAPRRVQGRSATPHHVGCRAGPKPEQVRFGAGVQPRTTSGAGQEFKVVKKKYGIGGEYIFCLSTLKPSKNIEGLVRAFKLLVADRQLPAVNLVIAGKKGWLYQSIFQLVKELDLEERVIFTGFVPDKEVPLFMEGAKVFVLPSFWEGFGIPILEAMSVGTPVVCANAGALPEVAGGAALLANPHRPEDMAKKIGQILNSNRIRQNLIKKGRARAAAFSWEKCSTIILKEITASLNIQK